MEAYIWLAVIIICAVIEGTTPQLIAIWFVAGSVGGLIASLCGAHVWLQIVIALVITIVSLVLTRPILKKKFDGAIVSTNADRFVGKVGVVTTEIDDITGAGRVLVMGSSWSAFTDEGKIIPENTQVIIKRIEGVKLFVQEAE